MLLFFLFLSTYLADFGTNLENSYFLKKKKSPYYREILNQGARKVNYLRWLCEMVLVILWDDYVKNQIIM